jgi:hypothetical protein
MLIYCKIHGLKAMNLAVIHLDLITSYSSEPAKNASTF